MLTPNHSALVARTGPLHLVREATARLEGQDLLGAVDLLARAIGENRDLPTAWFTLGRTLEALGRWSEAASAYEQVVRLRSEDAEAHKDLGRALVKCGRLEEAVQRFRRATTLAPHSAECQDLLGLALHVTGRVPEALDAYRVAIDLEPTRASAHHHLGLLLAERGDMTPALEHLEAATEHEPRRASYHRELARGALRARDVVRARAAATVATNLAPDDAVGHVVMGWTHEMAGAREASLASYRRALDLDPSQASPYYKLARAGAFEDLEAIAAQLGHPGRSRIGRSELEFARAEVYARRGEHREAWRAYAAGNAEVAAEAPYDPAAHRELTRRIVRATPSGLFAERFGMGDPNRLPVFVVGMPRSGTSLVEQILAAHPAVFGVGEHSGIQDLSIRLRRYSDAAREFPEGLRDLERGEAVRLAAEYLCSLARPQGDYDCLVDKAPGNFHFLGLIALVLPNARVIHVRRDPLDTCVSNWTTNFGQHRGTYANELESLAAYYEDYRTLMAHWEEVLPTPMLEVDYEVLVREPEAQARRLIQSLGLPWSEECMAFHTADRDVLTAGVLQVREPMHTRSVGRWEQYGPWLGELRRLSELEA